jgi:hypothetical protein
MKLSTNRLNKAVTSPRTPKIAPSSRHREVDGHNFGAPAGIRTPNQQIMSLLL